MIFKIIFDDNRTDWCTAKNILHLLKSYDDNYSLSIQNIESIDEISEEEAKNIMVKNSEFDEDNPNEMPEQISIYELSVGEDFALIASSDFF
jgi:hypothetical protein